MCKKNEPFYAEKETLQIFYMKSYFTHFKYASHVKHKMWVIILCEVDHYYVIAYYSSCRFGESPGEAWRVPPDLLSELTN